MTERQHMFLILGATIALSIAGIAFAVCVTRNATDGGRGGALAVALSFVVLFTTRGYGTKAYRIVLKEAAELKAKFASLMPGAPPPPPSGMTVTEQLDALFQKIETDVDGQRIQNIFLALSSGIGTIAWGFGDLAATALM